MIPIYEIRNGYWSGASSAIEENAAAPRGWTRTPVPTLAGGEYATWGGGKWVVTTNPPVSLRASVPQSISPFQARAALLEAGLMDQVSALMRAQSIDPLMVAAWEYAMEIRRDSPMLAVVASALSLTDAQVDALFVAAATKLA